MIPSVSATAETNDHRDGRADERDEVEDRHQHGERHGVRHAGGGQHREGDQAGDER